MRLTEFFLYAILTVASLVFVRAVTAERWTTTKRVTFTVGMAIILFVAVGVYWLRTGEKPDETAIRILLCPFVPESDRCTPVAPGGGAPLPKEVKGPSSVPMPPVAPPRVAQDASCLTSPSFACLRAGAVTGYASAALSRASCTREVVVLPSDVRWQDIWTTSVYSYAPGGGGPGGGLENDTLRIGGWGDWYHALVQFDVQHLAGPVTFAALLLHSKQDAGTPVAIFVDRITEAWGWKPGDRVWWKDRPRAVPLVGGPPPKIGHWYFIDITDTVEAWRTRKSPNFGLQLRPAANDNNYSSFFSSRAADSSKRPRLLVCV